MGPAGFSSFTGRVVCPGLCGTMGRSTSDPRTAPTVGGLTGHWRSDMTNRSCSIEGCERPQHARGWCKQHHKRWLRTGDIKPTPIHRPDALADFHRLLNRITDECVVWPNATNAKGYGSLSLPDGRKVRTHREALRIFTGIEPAGMLAIHGPCHNPACMNVRAGHVRWGTPVENMADKKRDGTENMQRSRRGRGKAWEDTHESEAA